MDQQASNPDSSRHGPPQSVSNHLQRFAVPRKLKGKTEPESGSFGVMVVQVDRNSEQIARGEAAKRTSENTALAALAAQTDGYVPLSRRRVPGGPAPNVVKPRPRPPPKPCCASLSLDLSHVKSEQTRLLTLFQRLPSKTVVDQLTRATSYFGGMPDTPPPPSTKDFPASAHANGSGSLLIAWLSEIFPPVDVVSPSPDEPAVNDEPNQKRARGRPKGSKNKKKKDAPPGENVTIPSEVESVRHQISLPPGRLTDVYQQLSVRGAASNLPSTPEIQNHMNTVEPSRNFSADLLLTPSGKRRGRPKGSKNRQLIANSSVNAAAEDSRIATRDDSIDTLGDTSLLPDGSANNKRKSGPGRPKGSKNKKPKNKHEDGDRAQPRESAITQEVSPPQGTAEASNDLGHHIRAVQNLSGLVNSGPEQSYVMNQQHSIGSAHPTTFDGRIDLTGQALASTPSQSRTSRWWQDSSSTSHVQPSIPSERDSSSYIPSLGQYSSDHAQQQTRNRAPGSQATGRSSSAISDLPSSRVIPRGSSYVSSKQPRPSSSTWTSVDTQPPNRAALPSRLSSSDQSTPRHRPISSLVSRIIGPAQHSQLQGTVPQRPLSSLAPQRANAPDHQEDEREDA